MREGTDLDGAHGQGRVERRHVLGHGHGGREHVGGRFDQVREQEVVGRVGGRQDPGPEHELERAGMADQPGQEEGAAGLGDDALAAPSARRSAQPEAEDAPFGRRRSRSWRPVARGGISGKAARGTKHTHLPRDADVKLGQMLVSLVRRALASTMPTGRVIVTPMPTAWPLMAAMVGLRIRYVASTAWPPLSRWSALFSVS